MKKYRVPGFRAYVLAASAAVLAIGAPTANAADGEWTGGSSVTWATSGNWSGGVPGAGDTATFNLATYLNAPLATNDLILGTMLFDTGNTGALTVNTGNNATRLNLTGGIQMNAGSGAVTIGGTGARGIAILNDVFFTNNSSSLLTVRVLTVDEAVLSGTATVTLNGSGSGGFQLSVPAINGATALLALNVNTTGGATLLNQASTYSGGTTLTQGLLQIGVASGGSVGAITSSAIGTGSLALNGGTIASNNNSARSILNATTVGGNVILGDATNTGVLTFSAGMDLTAGTRTLTTASNVTLAGIVSNGALTKAGAGTLTLTAANSYTGATLISAGTLQLGDGTTDGTIASSTSIVNNGTLAYNRVGNFTNGVVISGTGNLTKSGAGTQTLTVANTFSGTTTISAGTLELTNSLALQNSTLDTTASATSGAANGLKITTSALTLGGLSGNKTLATLFQTASGGLGGLSALTLNPGSGVNNSYTAILADGATGMTVTKNGLGTQALTGANTYSGTTTLNLGTLQINTSSTGDVGAITAGSLGTGALVLNGGQLSTSSTTGRDIFNATTIGGNFTLGDVTNNGTLTFSAGIDLGGSTRTLTTASSVNFNGIVSNGGIIKEGVGTLRMRGDATYAGGFTLNAGVVTINTNGVGSVGAITSSAFGTGTLTLNGGTVSSATATNRPILNAVTFGGNVGFGGGSGAGAGGIIFQAAADLGGATRTLTTTVDTTFNGIVSNGGITKEGAGILLLTDANTYSGATTVSAGILSLGNSLALQNSALNTTNSVTGDATNGLRTTVTTLTLGGLNGNKNLAATGGCSLPPPAAMTP